MTHSHFPARRPQGRRRAGRQLLARAALPVEAMRRRRRAKPVALTEVDAFLAIDAKGVVTVYSGKVDLGTGVRTALPQIAAEELDVPLTRDQARPRRHRAHARPGHDLGQPLDPDRRHADPQRRGDRQGRAARRGGQAPRRQAGGPHGRRRRRHVPATSASAMAS